MNKATILMYHNIATPPKGAKMRGLYVSPTMFLFQMWYLKFAGFKVVGLDEIRDFAVGRNSSEKLVAITFDDGYEDFYENAYPVLRRYEYPSTVFLVSDRMGQSNVWDSKQLNIEKKIMDWDRVNDLKNNGVTFGAHTRTHEFLAKIPEDEAFDQITKSKEILEAELGCTVDHFCYPYGSHNAKTVEIVRNAGFKSAVTTERGYVEQGDNPFILKRAFIRYRDYPPQFIYKLHSDYEKRSNA